MYSQKSLRGYPKPPLWGSASAPQTTPKPSPGAPHSQGNYVPEREEAVGAQRPEFDVVLLLSLTKWVQLNWGDEGLKRLFRRAFRHLRPGGILLLEPQPWESYRKRKGLTVSLGGLWGSLLGSRRGLGGVLCLELQPWESNWKREELTGGHRGVIKGSGGH